MKQIFVFIISKLVDFAGLFLTPIVAFLSLIQVRFSAVNLPLSYKIWDLFGVTPIRHHYYQPIFNFKDISGKIWDQEDQMAGVTVNIEEQISLLNEFKYQIELKKIPVNISRSDEYSYYYDNYNYSSGDSEILYNIIRHFKPKRIIEIGSGFSTRMAKIALDYNREQGFYSEHICIEPYEMPWLDKLESIKVIRTKVENVNLSAFSSLGENDILFIDSSHVIRTGGDVIAEYLHIIPNLNKGVLIHIHDIFLPYDYPKKWLQEYRRFWTEQYILQAFLSFNDHFKILLSPYYLSRNFSEVFAKACPVYANDPPKLPVSSFWIQKIA
jgi:hypothetical protein